IDLISIRVNIKQSKNGSSFNSLIFIGRVGSNADEKLNRIRDELIREFDREENDSIPTIDIHPRPPA
ncbi:unnamed protein product, partial [Rotaria sp. Silwood1]